MDFEACLLDNGIYDIEIGVMDEEGNIAEIKKVGMLFGGSNRRLSWM